MFLTMGTVQFGMEYGIQGSGRPSAGTVFEILDYALKNGIICLDTAAGYGDAEQLLGEYFNRTQKQAQILTKLPGGVFEGGSAADCATSAIKSTKESLNRLKTEALYGALFHNADDIFSDAAVCAIREIKRQGLSENIGVSVYEPAQAERALETGMDIVQIPGNIFDRRFDAFLAHAAACQTKVFARSVYLQGLLLMNEEAAGARLPAAAQKVREFSAACRESGFSRRQIAMAYMKEKSGVYSIVFGVDNLEQLKENLSAYRSPVPKEIVDQIAARFEDVDETIVSPLKWGLNRHE